MFLYLTVELKSRHSEYTRTHRWFWTKHLCFLLCSYWSTETRPWPTAATTSKPHTIKDVYIPNEPFQAHQKWKYFSIQCFPISETALLFFRVPMLHQFDILVIVECRWTNDEQSCATLSILYAGICTIIAATCCCIYSRVVSSDFKFC
jgi:hypothetical protein